MCELNHVPKNISWKYEIVRKINVFRIFHALVVKYKEFLFSNLVFIENYNK